MRFMARMKKMGMRIIIHARLKRIESWMLPRANDLVIITTLVSGNKICAIICKISGIATSGKYVPLSRDIGVMNRNAG